MSHAEFCALVASMRTAQRSYFNHRTTEALEASKKLERAVDHALIEFAAGPGLFDVTPPRPRLPGPDELKRFTGEPSVTPPQPPPPDRR